MCTAVVGGSIHRTATSISTASDQRSATPMRNHLMKDRRKLLRGGVSGMTSGASGVVSGFSVTLQNSRLGWIDIASDTSVIRYVRTCTTFQPRRNHARSIRGSKQTYAYSFVWRSVACSGTGLRKYSRLGHVSRPSADPERQRPIFEIMSALTEAREKPNPPNRSAASPGKGCRFFPLGRASASGYRVTGYVKP